MLILADHFDVPSRTLCLICFIWVPWLGLGMSNTSWISSKISGLLRSRIFMRSFRTMMMFCVRSSAPCFELFSAAPEGHIHNISSKLKTAQSFLHKLNFYNVKVLRERSVRKTSLKLCKTFHFPVICLAMQFLRYLMLTTGLHASKCLIFLTVSETVCSKI